MLLKRQRCNDMSPRLTDGTLPGRVAKARREVQLSGIVSVARIDATVWLRRLVIERLLRRVAAPSMMDFMARNAEFHLDPEQLLADVIGGAFSNRLVELRTEFEVLNRELENR